MPRIIKKSPNVGTDNSSVGSVTWSNPGFVGFTDSEAASVHTLSSGVVADASVRLFVNGVVAGDDKSIGQSLTGSFVTYTFGAEDDLWGLSLTPDDINSASFGIGISYQGNIAQSHYVVGSDFSFSIPPNATILGIKVSLLADVLNGKVNVTSANSLMMTIVYEEWTNVDMPITNWSNVPLP